MRGVSSPILAFLFSLFLSDRALSYQGRVFSTRKEVMSSEVC